jgi:hypothetical protein
MNIDDVLNKSDLIGFVTMAGGNPEKSGGRYSCACPLHGGENETAFSIYFDKGRWKWHCFTRDCGGGDAISFVEKWQGLKFKEACEFIMGEKVSDPEILVKSASDRLAEARIEEIAARERREARVKELQHAERHLFYHRLRGQWGVDAWNKRGLDEGMQEWFLLGACEDFTYKVKDEVFHSPTLSIPFRGEQGELLALQHRLINPHNPKDKYRPDITGIETPPFLSVPTMGYNGSLIVVVEGAIKSMVTWSRISEPDVQVIGVPVQGGYKRLTESLTGKNVIVIPDPNGNTTNEKTLQQPVDLARATNGKLLRLPQKVDDYLLATGMSANGFYTVLKQARKA